MPDFQRSHILICDDDQTVLQITSSILGAQGFQTTQVTNPKTCLEILARELPDILLLDVDMPGGSGYALCKKIREDYPDANLPILFFTANRGLEHEKEAFSSGGQDFIPKPVAPEILIARTQTHCQIKRQRDKIEAHKQELQAQVAHKTRSLAALQKITIFALTTLCGERDQETGSHILRTQLYVLTLARALQPLFPKLDAQKTNAIFRYAPLHDIGKIGIPDKILLKPGKLTPDEFDIIKTHTLIGHRSLEGAEALCDDDIPELETAKRIVRSHHEKWNGTGYPDALAGHAIPIEARIMAIADVYDALRSRRVYKQAMPHEKAAGIILAERGQHFDPQVTDAFATVQNKFEEIAVEYDTPDNELEEQKHKLETIC